MLSLHLSFKKKVGLKKQNFKIVIDGRRLLNWLMLDYVSLLSEASDLGDVILMDDT